MLEVTVSEILFIPLTAMNFEMLLQLKRAGGEEDLITLSSDSDILSVALGSKGTLVFALMGRVNRLAGGLLPMKACCGLF